VVTVREHHAGRWKLASNADRDGWVTLTETRDRGWRARLDGRPVPLRPYLAAFQAVEVPAGPHDVEWVYLPAGMPALLVGSALGWLLVVLLVRARRGRSAQLPVLV